MRTSESNEKNVLPPLSSLISNDILTKKALPLPPLSSLISNDILTKNALPPNPEPPRSPDSIGTTSNYFFDSNCDDEDNYICTTCNKSYLNKANLNRHIQTVHKKQKNS